MNVGSHRTLLVTATKELSRQWEQTKDSWQDAKSKEFEQKYLLDILSGVDRAAGVFEQLEKLVARVRNECE